MMRKIMHSRDAQCNTVFFSDFTFDFNSFHLKKLKTIQYNLFLNWCAEENLLVNNKDNRVLMSQNYRSDSCPLEIRCR